MGDFRLGFGHELGQVFVAIASIPDPPNSLFRLIVIEPGEVTENLGKAWARIIDVDTLDLLQTV